MTVTHAILGPNLGQAGWEAAHTVSLTASDVGAQPVDSDLTAIAALTTTAFGRGLLTLATSTSDKFLNGSGAFVSVIDGGTP